VHLNFEAVWPIHCIRTRQGALIFQRKQKRGNKSERQISKHLKKEEKQKRKTEKKNREGFQARSYVFFLVLLAVSMPNWFPCNMCILQTSLRGSNLIEAVDPSTVFQLVLDTTVYLFAQHDNCFMMLDRAGLKKLQLCHRKML